LSVIEGFFTAGDDLGARFIIVNPGSLLDAVEEKALELLGREGREASEILKLFEEELGLRRMDARRLLARLVARGLVERVPDYRRGRMVFRRAG